PKFSVGRSCNCEEPPMPSHLRAMLTGWGAAIALALVLGAPAHGNGKPVPVWSNDFTARLEALALLQTLNAELLSHDSATLTLDRWCDAHHLASPAKVVAVRDKAARKEPTAEQRKALGVSATEQIGYRRVKLTCGTRVLSEADNCYLPSPLTPQL